MTIKQSTITKDIGQDSVLAMDNIRFAALIIKKEYDLIREILSEGSFSSYRFETFSMTHQLAGYFYLQIKEGGLEHCFPGGLMERFERIYIKQWIDNERLLKEIEEIGSIFDKARKEVIFLKGPFFTQRIYGNIDQRKIRDIDILVKKDDIESANDLLIACGYELTSKILLGKSLTFKFTHHLEYWKKDIPLDMHWALDRHCSYKLDYEKIWQTKFLHTHKNGQYYMMSYEYQLIFRILSILKDMQMANLTLRSCLDAYMLLKHIYNDVDWEKFFLKCRDENIFRISVNILDFVLSVFDCREEFPELDFFINSNENELKYSSLDDKLMFFDRAGGSWVQKKRSLGLYGSNVLRSFGWWAISLPFRMAIHQEYKGA